MNIFQKILQDIALYTLIQHYLFIHPTFLSIICDSIVLITLIDNNCLTLILLSPCYYYKARQMAYLGSLTWVTSKFHIDTPDINNGQFQKWKVDKSI